MADAEDSPIAALAPTDWIFQVANFGRFGLYKSFS